MTREQLLDNIAMVRSNVAEAAKKAGRAPEEVRLLAVTKTVEAERIALAHEAGLTDFAENYIQELTGKLEQLPDYTWHMIGHLQSNKYKYIADKGLLIHTLDSLSLAEQMQRHMLRLGGRQRALLQVNIGREPQKSGLLPEEVPAFAEKVLGYEGIDLKGLMCIPPAGQDARRYYEALRMLAEKCAQSFGAGCFTELSMGMSADYETAIEEGATMVRVGSRIFGKRM